MTSLRYCTNRNQDSGEIGKKKNAKVSHFIWFIICYVLIYMQIRCNFHIKMGRQSCLSYSYKILSEHIAHWTESRNWKRKTWKKKKNKHSYQFYQELTVQPPPIRNFSARFLALIIFEWKFKQFNQKYLCKIEGYLWLFIIDCALLFIKIILYT